MWRSCVIFSHHFLTIFHCDKVPELVIIYSQKLCTPLFFCVYFTSDFGPLNSKPLHTCKEYISPQRFLLDFLLRKIAMVLCTSHMSLVVDSSLIHYCGTSTIHHSFVVPIFSRWALEWHMTPDQYSSKMVWVSLLRRLVEDARWKYYRYSWDIKKHQVWLSIK